MKVCTPEDMVGYTESAKCLKIKKVFEDAYRSDQNFIFNNHDQVLNILKLGFRIRIVLEPFYLSVDPGPNFDIKKIK